MIRVLLAVADAQLSARLGARFEAAFSGQLQLEGVGGALEHSKRSGQLVVLAGGAEATTQLRGGRLIHASFERSVGEDAVTATFARADRDPKAHFRFLSSTALLAAPELVTIDTPVDKLLFQVAVALDEQRRIATSASF